MVIIGIWLKKIAKKYCVIQYRVRRRPLHPTSSPGRVTPPSVPMTSFSSSDPIVRPTQNPQNPTTSVINPNHHFVPTTSQTTTTAKAQIHRTTNFSEPELSVVESKSAPPRPPLPHPDVKQEPGPFSINDDGQLHFGQPMSNNRANLVTPAPLNESFSNFASERNALGKKAVGRFSKLKFFKRRCAKIFRVTKKCILNLVKCVEFVNDELL